MDRRGFLAVAGTVLGTGCSSALPSGSTPSPTRTPTPTTTPSPSPDPTPRVRQARDPEFTPASDPYTGEYGRTGGIALDAGEYAAFSVAAEEPVVLRYAFEVIEGDGIDAMVMRSGAFEGYRNEASSIRLFGSASVDGSSGDEVTVRLPAGDHVLVFDNTVMGSSGPSGPVRLRFGMALGTKATPTPVPTPTPFPFGEARTPAFTPSADPYAENYARSGGLALARGAFTSFVFQHDGGFTLRYAFDVVEGGAVDALVMGRSAFEKYLGEQSAGFYANASVQGSSGDDVTVTLPGGEHALVFDNTYLGKTRPRGAVKLRYGLGFGSGSESGSGSGSGSG